MQYLPQPVRPVPERAHLASNHCQIDVLESINHPLAGVKRGFAAVRPTPRLVAGQLSAADLGGRYHATGNPLTPVTATPSLVLRSGLSPSTSTECLSSLVRTGK
jgi:hypothetical protein